MFTRKTYDSAHVKSKNFMSSAHGMYALSSHRIIDTCLPSVTVPLPKGKRYDPRVMAEIESNLKGLDINSGKFASSKQFLKREQKAQMLKSKVTRPNSDKCSNKLSSSFSRMENPAIDVRSATFSRFDFPLQDPRNYVFMGSNHEFGDHRLGIDTRAQAKFSDQTEYHNNLDKKL